MHRAPQRTFACRAEAAAPAVCSRLKALAARASQTALACNLSEGACASGPFFSSAIACSMMAWSRQSHPPRRRQRGVGDESVVAPQSEQLFLSFRSVELEAADDEPPDPHLQRLDRSRVRRRDPGPAHVVDLRPMYPPLQRVKYDLGRDPLLTCESRLRWSFSVGGRFAHDSYAGLGQLG